MRGWTIFVRPVVKSLSIRGWIAKHILCFAPSGPRCARPKSLPAPNLSSWRRTGALRLVLNPVPPDANPSQRDACGVPLGRVGGGGWIRTTEGSANRFTVCPLWPLGNPSSKVRILYTPPYHVNSGEGQFAALINNLTWIRGFRADAGCKMLVSQWN